MRAVVAGRVQERHAQQGWLGLEFSRVRACISIRGAERPARAPLATVLHGALGNKKAALRPTTARRTSVDTSLIVGGQDVGTFVGDEPSWRRAGFMGRNQRTIALISCRVLTF